MKQLQFLRLRILPSHSIIIHTESPKKHSWQKEFQKNPDPNDQFQANAFGELFFNLINHSMLFFFLSRYFLRMKKNFDIGDTERRIVGGCKWLCVEPTLRGRERRTDRRTEQAGSVATRESSVVCAGGEVPEDCPWADFYTDELTSSLSTIITFFYTHTHTHTSRSRAGAGSLTAIILTESQYAAGRN